MTLKLIDNWRYAWRLISLRAMSVALAVQATWLSLPVDLRVHIPDRATAALTAVLLITGLVGRLIRQEKAHGPSDA
jgi:hypothetical protein